MSRNRKSSRKDGFGEEDEFSEKHIVCGLNTEEEMSGRQFEMGNWHLRKGQGWRFLIEPRTDHLGTPTF